MNHFLTSSKEVTRTASGEGKVIAGAQKGSVNESNCSKRVRARRADIPQLCFLVGVSTSKNARCPNDAAARLRGRGGGAECDGRDGAAEGQKIPYATEDLHVNQMILGYQAGFFGACVAIFWGKKSNSTAMPRDKEAMFYTNGPGSPPFFITCV